MNIGPRIILNMGQEKEQLTWLHSYEMHRKWKQCLQCHYKKLRVLTSSQRPCLVGVGYNPCIQREKLRPRKQGMHFRRGEWQLMPPNPFLLLRSVPAPQSAFFAQGQTGLLNTGCRSSSPKPLPNHFTPLWQQSYCAHCKQLEVQTCQITMAFQEARTCLKLAK